MNVSDLEFKIDTAQYPSILEHLLLSADFFIPRLKTYVNIEEYSKKIYQNAITFELWGDNKLIGLAAAYFNSETSICFLTNLSLLKDFQKLGLASTLILGLINYAKDHEYKVITLEVNFLNEKAKNFYKKHGFIEKKIKNNVIEMEMIL